ncbi:protein translocase subunit SecE [Synergistales bacterium]|nr:protein translocase subunit SecE [Synergistales bacterium]GHV54168.1 protein translocase subunit SecE [Synergistales bacterium]
MEKVLTFIRESKVELLKKVTWPTRKQVLASTWVVVALTVVVSLYLFAIDTALTYIASLILG